MLRHSPFVSLVVLLAAACGSKSTPEPGLEKLHAFGIDTELGALTDAQGKPLPGNANPLGRVVSYLKPKREIFVAGVKYNVSSAYPGRALLLDDGLGAFTPLWGEAATNDSFVENPLASTAADVNGDGNQEAVTLYFARTGGGSFAAGSNPGAAHLTVLSAKPYARTDTTIKAFTDLVTHAGSEAAYLVAIACGDLDADGKDECALVVGNTLVVVDDATASYKTLLGPIDFANGVPPPELRVNRVAVGDINGDFRDEIVVTDGLDGSQLSSYHVYGGAPLAEIDTGTVTNGIESMQFGNVAVGDLDGDRVADVAFAGDNPDGGSYFFIFAARWKDGKLKFFPGASLHKDRDWDLHRVVALKIFNPDGLDTRAKGTIFAHRYLAEVDDATGAIVDRFAADADIPTPTRDLVFTGDVLGNGREAAVFLTGGNLDVYGIDDATKWGSIAALNIDNASGAYPSIALPEIDADTPIVKYTGKHELLFPNPRVVAVLASPPYWAGLQDGQSVLGNCGTYFSKTTTAKTESSHTFTVSAGVSVGVSAEAPVLGKTAFSIEEKATFLASFSAGFSRSVETSVERGFATAPGEDAVLISCVPFDVFTYQVVSSPDPAAVGTEFPLSVPRKVQMVPFERNTYNKLVDDADKIGADVLTHEIGKPRSYPTHAEMLAKVTPLPHLWDPDGAGMGLGNSIWSTTVTQGTASSTDIGAGVDVTLEIETTTAGLLVGSSRGFGYHYQLSLSTGDSTTIQGVVPNLPVTADLTKYGYKFGVTGYQLPKPNDFFVVTYWVE